MLLEYYKELLGNIPSFMKKYLRCSSLKRLKKVGYFCGMDYASKDIYDFKDVKGQTKAKTKNSHP